MQDSEQAHDFIEQKNKAAAEAAAKARAVVAQLPEWVRPRALGYDHRASGSRWSASTPASARRWARAAATDAPQTGPTPRDHGERGRGHGEAGRGLPDP